MRGRERNRDKRETRGDESNEMRDDTKLLISMKISRQANRKAKILILTRRLAGI